MFIHSEDEAREALDLLAAWWVKERVGTSTQVDELEALREAIETLTVAWGKIRESSQTQFKNCLLEEQKGIRDFYSEHLGNGWEWIPIVSESLAPARLFYQLQKAADAVVAQFTETPKQKLARAGLRHPEMAVCIAGDPSHIDFQASFYLARIYFEATGNKPKSETPEDHEKKSNAECPKTEFENLVHAVWLHVFEGKGSAFSSLRTTSLQPAARTFWKLAFPDK